MVALILLQNKKKGMEKNLHQKVKQHKVKLHINMEFLK